LPSSQFNTVRHAFLFKPGQYSLDAQLGYYTSVAGLGLSPDDVTIEVPNTPGVQFHDLVTVSLGGVGTIEHVINGTGGTANTSNQVIDLLSYP
jgi:hypothetical protein